MTRRKDLDKFYQTIFRDTPKFRDFSKSGEMLSFVTMLANHFVIFQSYLGIFKDLAAGAAAPAAAPAAGTRKKFRLSF